MRDSLGETVFEIRLRKSLRINERSETKKVPSHSVKRDSKSLCAGALEVLKQRVSSTPYGKRDVGFNSLVVRASIRHIQ